MPVRRSGLLWASASRSRRPTRSGRCWRPGITAWLCIQAFINIGVVVALIPVTGITLPFISAGGSSLIISLAAVGILLSISRETVERGTWNDAAADRRGRDGRAYLPGPRRGPLAPRSTRSTDAPELVWLGGHRGLEADLVRDAGIRVRRLALRSLRTVDLIVHTVLDPLRLAAVGARRRRRSSPRERPAAIFTTGGYVAVPVAARRRPAPDPGRPLGGQRRSPAARSGATARLADAIAVSYEATGRALAPGRRRRRYVTGTPIRDVTAIVARGRPGAARPARRRPGRC